MVDPLKLTKLQQEFSQLLTEPATHWPEADIAYVREECGHGQHDDALDNPIALRIRNGRGFSPEEARQFETLAVAMDMAGTPLLMKLRHSATA